MDWIHNTYKKNQKSINNKEQPLQDTAIVNKITTNINKNLCVIKNEIKTEINKVEDKVDRALVKATSLIKYLMENFSHVPALQKLSEHDYIEKLRIDYKHDGNVFVNEYKNSDNNNKYELEIILIDDFHRNLFVRNISKTMLDFVNHKNPDKQPIYNTDSSRRNFVIKVNTNWNEDILGLKFTEIIINPILLSIEKLIYRYRTDYLEMINIRKNNLDTNIMHIEWMSKTLDFERKLHNQEFVKPILKELSAHLRFVKNELNKLDKIEKVEKVEKVEKIEKVKKIDKVEELNKLDFDEYDNFNEYDSIKKIKKRLI